MAIAEPSSPPAAAPRPQRRRRLMGHGSLMADGEPMIWLTGGALAICLLMIVTLIVGVSINALAAFWPAPLVEIKLLDGRTLLGEPTRSESYTPDKDVLDSLPPAAQESARKQLAKTGGVSQRTLYRTGNYELTGEHFTWVSDFQVAEQTNPPWGLVLERLASGRFYGVPAKFLIEGTAVADTPQATWQKFNEYHAACRDRWQQGVDLQQNEIGRVNARQEAARLAAIEARLDYAADSPQVHAAEEASNEVQQWASQEFARIKSEVDVLANENKKYQLALTTWLWTDNKLHKVEHPVQVSDIVRAYPANQLGTWQKLGVYGSRWWEFVSAGPRMANSEGGVFPAIWGTVVMTLIMSLAVVPFGVLAALFLREYAKAGWVVSCVRISINNLAGVPSIVFGVFGLGFFCYIVGGFVDGGPEKIGVAVWPSPLWFAMLACLAGLATGAFMLGLYNLTPRAAEASRRSKLLGRVAICMWIASSVLFVLVILKSPFFDGFYRAKVANNIPTFGKGGLLWSSITLALLTLPVVIVATEEALASVPNSMREGSYGCGASKWQTIRRIVLPRAMPGIMTGMILAMARGAGEVAPLMLVGAVKIVPDYPVDLTPPFVHPDRSFMHLGFHIFDLGFQSQNSEAAVPVVYATTLLLILIIGALNLTAIWLRARLRRKFMIGKF